MRPTNGSVVYRPDLGSAVMEFVDSQAVSMIGLQVMPIFRTAKQSSTFPVVPKEQLLKVQDTSRAARSKYNRGDWEYERGSYATRENGWEEPVDDSERAMLEQESPGLADMIASQRAMGIIMRNQEKRIAGKIFNATNFTPNTVAAAWNDKANAVPVDNVADGVNALRLHSGMAFPDLIISFSTFMDLKNCDQVVDRLKYTFPGIDLNQMTSSQLAQVFNVRRVLVGGAVADTAAKGVDPTVGDIWSNTFAALVHTSTTMDVSAPCVGRTFLWTADSPVNPIVESYRDDAVRSDILRVRHDTDEALMRSYNDDGSVQSDIAANMVYLMDGITV